MPVIIRLYDIYDTNTDGVIHLQEFRKAFARLEKNASFVEYKEADANFRSVDKNDDGIVSYSEYIIALLY